MTIPKRLQEIIQEQESTKLSSTKEAFDWGTALTGIGAFGLDALAGAEFGLNPLADAAAGAADTAFVGDLAGTAAADAAGSAAADAGTAAAERGVTTRLPGKTDISWPKPSTTTYPGESTITHAPPEVKIPRGPVAEPGAGASESSMLPKLKTLVKNVTETGAAAATSTALGHELNPQTQPQTQPSTSTGTSTITDTTERQPRTNPSSFTNPGGMEYYGVPAPTTVRMTSSKNFNSGSRLIELINEIGFTNKHRSTTWE